MKSILSSSNVAPCTLSSSDAAPCTLSPSNNAFFLSSDYASCSSYDASCYSDDESPVNTAFTNDYFQTTDDVHRIPNETAEDSSSHGKGAREFFDDVSGGTTSQSASEECPKESSDAKFFNINFSLPGNDFWTYFPAASNKLSNFNKFITSITIPDSIIKIKKQAFSDCIALVNIRIPNSVSKIGKWAFSGCYSLRYIKVPNSVSKIGKYAFSGCSSLRQTLLPNSIREIGSFVFSECYNLSEINIPKYIEKIGKYILPFSFLIYKTNLYSIHIPNIIGFFNKKILFGEKYLNSIEIPESVKIINNSNVFPPSINYDSFMIANTTTVISNYAESGGMIQPLYK